MLNYTVEGSGPRLVLAHGFTQTLASFAPLARHLRGRYQLVAVDLPGHGGSAGARPASLPQAAGLLAEVGGAAAYLGYSMGGRVCLQLALDRPELVRALVLVGATPGIEDPAARAERRAADEALAASIERDGVAAFLDRWLAQPLFRTLPPERAGREARLANTPEGLAAALRQLGTGAQAPLWERLGELRAPTLLVAGELDAKFAAIARRVAALTGAEVALVPGAGHAAHLERPAEVAALVRSFLEGH